MIGSSKVYSPSLLDSLADDEVVVGTFHFGGTCVGLAHNYAGQRLGVDSVLERCRLAIEKNDKGPDGEHAVSFLKPGSASVERRRSKVISVFPSYMSHFLYDSECVLVYPINLEVGYLKQRMSSVVLPLALSNAIALEKCIA